MVCIDPVLVSSLILLLIHLHNKNLLWDFPRSPVVKTPAPSARGVGLILGGGTEIPHATWCSQK